MVTGIIDTPENLVEKYKICRRLAVRVGALVGLGVRVTAAVLDEAVRKKDVEEALISGELFEAAGGGSKGLQEWVSKNPGFVVVADESAQVIALSEEVLAERALPPALRRKAQIVLSGHQNRSRNLPFLNELLLAGGPANEETRSWKIKFLTGGIADDRIEALRHILVFDLDPGEKASILFYALRDDDHMVISEAVRAFKQLGLSPGVADNLIKLVRGDQRSREDALERLQRDATKSDQRESDVIIAVTGRLIRDDELQDLKARLLKLLRSLLRGREGSSEDVQDMVRLLVRNVPLDQEDAQLTLRDILLSVGKGKASALSEALWEEADSLGFGAHRTMLLSLIGRIENRRAGLEKLDGILLDAEFRLALDRGHDLSNYRYILVRRYQTLFPALLAQAAEFGEERRAAIFRGLSEVLHEVEMKPSTAAHRVKALLSLAERSGKTVRRVLMRSRLHSLGGLPRPLADRLATMYISLLEPEFLPEHNREVWSAIMEIGWTAAPRIAEFIEKDSNDVRLRRESMDALQEIIADDGRFPPVKEELERMLRKFEKLASDRGFDMRGEMGPLIASSLLSQALGGRMLSTIAARLVRRLGAGYSPMDVAAMAHVARSDRVDPELKKRMVRRLLKILEEGEGSAVSSVTAGEDGTVVEMADGTPIHMQQIPGALCALRDAALSLSQDDPGIAYLISRFLMRKWEEVSSWKRIWSATSRENLLDALGRIALCDAVPATLAAEVFVFLARKFLNQPYDPRLALAVAMPLKSGRFEKAGGIAVKIFRKMMEVAEDPESTSPDAASRFLLAAALVASAPDSPVCEGPDRSLAVRLLDLIERRSPLGLKEDRQAVFEFASAQSLPTRLRSRAESILSLFDRPAAK